MTAEQVALTDDRGVLKTITKSGNPKLRPLKGDKVYVHYTGTYVGGDEDGQEFDCSRKRGSKFDFTLGKGEVISAWDICLATMCVGERCELICSSDYGYKDEKTRKFDIEMFGYDGEDVSFDKDMSVTKSVIEQGETIAPPLAGSSITMTYKNILTDEERSVTYTLGDPTESNVPLGIDVALRKMYLGEKAVVKIKNLKESGDDSNSTPYEVYVKNFDKVPRINSHKTFKEQLEHAESMKSRANEFFKNKKYSISLEIYKRLDEEIMFLTAGQPTESDSLKDFKMKLYCNMALVYFNQKNYGECESFCNKALEIDEKNEKSLFRLGMIKVSIGDHDEACKLFNQCISYHPDNVVAKRMLQQSKKKVNEERNKTHKMFRKIYEKCSDTGLGITEPEPKEEPSKDSVSEESEEDEAAGSEKAEA